MKKIYLFIGLALSMLAGGCSKEDPKVPETPGGEDDVTVRITATISEENLLWSEGATIAVNGLESSALAAGGEATASFEVVNASAPLKVVAPFKAYTAGDIITVPDTQTYVADGYDAGAFVMYGYTDTVSETEDKKVSTAEVEMHAACGIVKLPMTIAEGAAAVKTVALTAADSGDVIAGEWKVDFSTGNVTVEKGFDTVNLDCGETGVALGAAAVDFRFVIPAAAYAKGVIIEATDTENHKFVYEYTDALTVEAGAETALAPLAFQIIEKEDATLNISIAEPAITWIAGDEVVVNGVLSSAVADADAGKSTAAFDLKQVAHPYTVLYPRDLYTTSGRLRFYDEQRLLENDFDREALAMVGYSHTADVTLHNVCGLIKIPITNNYETDVVTMNKVCLTSNDGKALAGKFNINYRNATLSEISAVETLTLLPEEGSEGIVIPVGETVYVYAVIPEGKFPKGLTIDVYSNVANLTGVQCTPAGGLNITRGEETEIPAVEYAEVKIEKITTAEEFIALAAAINRGRTDRFKNAAGDIVLANDIDLAGVEISQITGLDGAGFVDVFDGQGFALKNMTVSGPLFKENKGTIKNVVFDGCHFDNSIIGENAADAVVSGITMTATCDVEFAAPTNAWGFGFIVGENAGIVEKCTNSINYQKEIASLPSEKSCNFGGIVGSSTGTISDCSFNGTFDMTVSSPAKSTYHTFAGIVGYIKGASDQVLVNKCTNGGTVHVTIGTACYFSVGGIVGSTPTAKKCPGDYGVVEECENNGNVGITYIAGGSGAYPVCGGVCGNIEGYIRNCTNKGVVSLENRAATATWTCAKHGGVAGIVTKGAKDCHNYGQVTVIKGNFAGGTAGARNAGNNGLSCWAGVIAAAGPASPDSDIKFENCTNNVDLNLMPGTVTGSPQFSYGGVFGYLTATAENCVNHNPISVNAGTYITNIGGVAGACDGYLVNCTNYGNLTAVATSYAVSDDVTKNNRWFTRFGGVAGWVSVTTTSSLSKCTNSGNLNIIDGNHSKEEYNCFVGGVFGTSNSSSNKINLNEVEFVECNNTGTISGTEGLNIYVGEISGQDSLQ